MRKKTSAINPTKETERQRLPARNVQVVSELKLLPIETLKPNPRNARMHSDAQIEKIRESILRFGMITPVIVDKSGMIIAGHGRFEAAKRARLGHLPVICADHLSPEEIRAFALADNRLAEESKWDTKILAIELKSLVEAELSCTVDWSAEITGFSSPEIDVLISSADEEEESPTATIEPVLEKPPISREGDIWRMGRHRIACGDSLDADLYKRLLRGETIYLICSDPPYNVEIPGFVSGNGAVKHRNFGMASGEMSKKQFIEFLIKVFKNSLAGLPDGGCLYCFIDWRHVGEALAMGEACGLILLNICVWDKNVGGMGSLYRGQHEFCCVFRKGGKQHRNNIQLGKFGRNRTNVWQYPSANMSKEGRKALKDHPTPKPIPMIADIIRDVTKPNDLVFDPFLGGGSCLIAAEKTKRRCYGIELDPHYVDCIIRRWQEHTGENAIHEGTGKSFAECEAKATNDVARGRHVKIRER